MQGRAQSRKPRPKSRQAVLAAVTPTKVATRTLTVAESMTRFARASAIATTAATARSALVLVAKVRVSRLDATARLTAVRLAGRLHDSLAGRRNGQTSTVATHDGRTHRETTRISMIEQAGVSMTDHGGAVRDDRR
jgi:hypothetical protein